MLVCVFIWFYLYGFCGFSVISVLMRGLKYSALDVKNNFLRYLFAWRMKDNLAFFFCFGDLIPHSVFFSVLCLFILRLHVLVE